MSYQAGQVVQVTTVDVAHGGWCVARPDDGPVVFVRHALPGETVLARVTEVTSRLARAEAVEILTRRIVFRRPARTPVPVAAAAVTGSTPRCPPSGRSRPP
jgi:tRNA/tmRNA/rRNA uracil-C5-methylase (TrmA/RlmC/RlmD family)